MDSESSIKWNILGNNFQLRVGSLADPNLAWNLESAKQFQSIEKENTLKKKWNKARE